MNQNLRLKTITFTRATNGNFVNLFAEIVQALLQHQDTFTNLPFTPAQLLERRTALTEKSRAAEKGSEAQKNERDLERMQCEEMLFRLQTSVLQRALVAPTFQERAAIAQLSKFSLCKKRERVGLITAPMPRIIMTRAQGVVLLKWRLNKNVRSWIIEHVAGTDVSPSANWQMLAVTTRSRYAATGLPSGYHAFRLRAVSSAGQGAPSPAVTEWAR